MFARSRVRSALDRWLAGAALLVALAGLAAAPCPEAAAADDDAAVVAIREEVERLRREMETAYLDVQKDAERTRAAEWAGTPFGDDFSSALAVFVRDARARSEARTAQQDMEDAAAVLRPLAARGVEPPLTRTSALVVLAETARAARGDRTATARDLFVTATRTVFAASKPEDVWDACFLDLPVVQAFRAAQQRLAAALASAENARAKPAETTPPAPDKDLEEVVAFEKSRPWLGPWTGWTSDVTEKQNKRQQRSVKAFWMDRFEVTCEQYAAFLESLPASARRPMLPLGWTLGEDDRPHLPEGKGRHPVTGVTLRQAAAYAESRGKRLPTSDEWERAAAGGEKDARTYPWGPSEEGKKWSHLGVEPKATVPVDAFPDDATPEGVIGMAGNVAEMVATYPDRNEVGKSGPEKEKQILVCGGSFNSRASECATSWRWVIDADGASPSVGFRCVMDEAEYRKRRK